MSPVVAVAAGGAIGAALRYLAVQWMARAAPGLPWGTLFVNVLGSLLMGVAAAVILEKLPMGWGRLAPFVLSGLLGGFTTFSAFSLETVTLIERGQTGQAALYVGLSVLGAVGGLALGMGATRAVLT